LDIANYLFSHADAHCPFDDSAKASGTKEEVMREFKKNINVSLQSIHL